MLLYKFATLYGQNKASKKRIELHWRSNPALRAGIWGYLFLEPHWQRKIAQQTLVELDYNPAENERKMKNGHEIFTKKIRYYI